MANNQCLICKSSSFEQLLHMDAFPIFFGAVPLERRGKVKKYPLTVAICNQCSLVQQVNLLPTDVLDDVYTSDYYSCPAPSENQVGHRVINEFYSFFKKNEPNKNGPLLEVACFDGYLLSLLKNDGWDVYGCDPAGQTKEAVKKFGSDRIVNDFFSKEKYAGKRFDVIIFRHLLEHLYDLHTFLDDVFHILNDDGYVFIEVPNIYSTFDSGGLGSFFHQHISHFSIETLDRLLSGHGFKIESYVETSVLHVRVRKAKVLEKGGALTASVQSRREAFLNKYNQLQHQVKKIFANPAYKRIAIFGASAGATTMVNIISVHERSKICYVFDNDLLKQGKYIEGVDAPISSPKTAIKADFDIVIISSYIFSDEMIKQLLSLGVEAKKIISLADALVNKAI